MTELDRQKFASKVAQAFFCIMEERALSRNFEMTCYIMSLQFARTIHTGTRGSKGYSGQCGI
jgi:hypothetical protein